MREVEERVTENQRTGNEPLIRVEHCSIVFGRRAQQALEMKRQGKSKAEVERATGSTIGAYDATFDVYPGEIFVIIGLSGSGKSTILRAINGLNEPTEGDVYLDGDNITRMPAKPLREVRRKKIGMVFQHFGLLPNRTVLDNIAFGLEIQGMSAQERRKKAEEALPAVGLEGQGDKLITELSGGMKQRVGLARALATEQEILLMDEPFSALDALIRRDMQNLFLSIQGEVQRTVVFVTHDLDEALTLGHRVAIMNAGEIVQLGTPEQILREPANEYVERFVEGVDYAKVRTAESVMVRPKEVAYLSEGPTVVLRRMRQTGLSHIFVVDEDRRIVGLCEAEEVARLAERGERELRDSVDDGAAKVGRRTPLREVLPLFVDDADAPVAVVDEGNRLEGVVVRGALIAGLTTHADAYEEDEGHDGLGDHEASENGDRVRVRRVGEYGMMLAQTELVPRIPLADWTNSAVGWVQETFEPITDPLGAVIEGGVEALAFALLAPPELVIIAVFAAIAFFLANWRIALFTVLGLLLVISLEMWEPAMYTLALVLTSAAVALLIGIPTGILASKSRGVEAVVMPVLDTMQTMPAFVYLVPVVALFSLGNTPALIATVIFAMPPAVRLTMLGVQQVPKDTVEAAHAFGATPWQTLLKVELPLSVKSIMAGVNQTIMLSLSMVVLAALVGAEGLGQPVLVGLGNVDTGAALVGGLGIVVLAIILDRITRGLTRRDSGGVSKMFSRGKSDSAPPAPTGAGAPPAKGA